MRLLVNLRLVLLTAGTLLPFFWMVVILGHRRQRNFERVFFFLCLALTLFSGSGLLALNAELYYGTPPPALLRFAWTFLCLGLWLIPPLVVHLHAEYAAIRNLVAPGRKMAWLVCAWLPAILLVPFLIAAIGPSRTYAFSSPSRQLGLPFQIWLVVAVLCGACWQRRFANASPDGEQQAFHKNLARILALLSVLLVTVVALGRFNPSQAPWSSLVAMILALVPLVGLIGQVQRFNFLQIGRQRNLSYAVFIVFVALLYLSFARRAGQWLEPYLPPEASAALLLFLPVVFFEPLQRVMGNLLRRTAQREVDRAQRLMGPINEVARSGDLERLKTFSERWIAEQLQLAEVKLETPLPDTAAEICHSCKKQLGGSLCHRAVRTVLGPAAGEVPWRDGFR